MGLNKSTAPRWEHQAKEYADHADSRSRALIWPMRSGKSRAVVDVGTRQFKRHLIEGAIIVAPNGVHLNWARNEIPTWCSLDFPNPTFCWETPKRDYPEKQAEWERFLAAPGMKWMCVNMEALSHPDCVRAMNRFLKVCHRNFMFAISEAHHFGHAGTKRTLKARSLSYHAAFVRTETGTPILTGPLRAFSQYEILAPGALGYGRYKPFKEYYSIHEPYGAGLRKREKLVRYQNLDELTSRIAKWSSLVLRSELGDMPELLRIERPVVMSDKQRAAYIRMVAEHLAEVPDGDMKVKDAAARMMKMQQILSGYVMNTEMGAIHTIDADAPIYDAVIDEIKGTIPGKALVWCRYKEDCRRLAAKLRERKMPVLEYWGDFTTTVREENRAQFLAPGDESTMIGTPDCGGEGLDFSAADAVIFMSANPNARMMAQAEERATVKGGKSVSVIRVRNYGTVDDRMWNIIDGNILLADSITGSGLRRMLNETDV